MSQLLAAWVPGLPHLLYPEKSQAWKPLNEGFNRLGQLVRDERPDAIVFYSSQWMSVLGTSFQVQPNPKGVHVDENWYDFPDLPFDFKTDPALGEKLAAAVKAVGYPTKTVNYEEFPIDTGTLVALRFLDPQGKIPVCGVSSWVYANAEVSQKIGAAMAEAARKSGKKVLFLASSLLSTRYFTEEIDPSVDRISKAGDDVWNKRILDLMTAGQFNEIAQLVPQMAKEVMLDMQFNAFHWLKGVLAGEKVKGELLAYGPQWGCGAAVVAFKENK